MVNLSLLAKWKWRLLQHEQPLWKRVLLEKYGDHVGGLAPSVGTRWPRFTSLWWRDLMSLEEGVDELWFSNRVVRKIGNGRHTSFWKDRWIGVDPLYKVYPRLFSISTQKEATVRDLVSLQGGACVWELNWRRNPFLWELNLVDILLASLEGVILGSDVDRWVWLPEKDGCFSVKSMYMVLERILLMEVDFCSSKEAVFEVLWRSPAPSKVVAFSWTLLLDRIPTRANLAIRNILEPDSSLLCVLCDRTVETSSHLFLHCDVAYMIWRRILDWLDFNFVTSPNLFVHFECWSREATPNKIKKGAWLIWHATIWAIWNERNARIFNNQRKEVEEIVDGIKAVSWFWALSRLRIASFLFYEWTWNLRECLSRR